MDGKEGEKKMAWVIDTLIRVSQFELYMRWTKSDYEMSFRRNGCEQAKLLLRTKKNAVKQMTTIVKQIHM